MGIGAVKTLEETQNKEYRSWKADLPQGSQELCTVPGTKKGLFRRPGGVRGHVPQALDVSVITSFSKKKVNILFPIFFYMLKIFQNKNNSVSKV